MSLTFYFNPMSTAAVTDLVIAELQLPCERIYVDLQKGDTKKPEFTKVNPNGKIPVIVHDGTAIFESSAITMYLGDVFGVEKKLWPAAGPKRGEAMKWVAWCNVTFVEAVVRWAEGSGAMGSGTPDPKVAEKGKADVERCLTILDAGLAGRSFLCGTDYTLADTHLSSFVDWLGMMKFDASKWKNVSAWSARCAERPASKKAAEEMKKQMSAAKS